MRRTPQRVEIAGVKGHPLLWLVVLVGMAAGAFAMARDWLRDLDWPAGVPQHAPVKVTAYAALYAAFGLACVWQWVRVARLCWETYIKPEHPAGACRHCGYDLRASPGTARSAGRPRPGTATRETPRRPVRAALPGWLAAHGRRAICRLPRRPEVPPHA